LILILTLIYVINYFIREMSSTNASSKTAALQKPIRLAPEVNKIIFVRNLPYKITNE
jgi:hypothetical protein